MLKFKTWGIIYSLAVLKRKIKTNMRYQYTPERIGNQKFGGRLIHLLLLLFTVKFNRRDWRGGRAPVSHHLGPDSMPHYSLLIRAKAQGRHTRLARCRKMPILLSHFCAVS
jgi:hypothetical protein